jgi:hypothetical protein
LLQSAPAAIGPTQARKRLRERREATLLVGIVFVAPAAEHADAPHAVALLPARRERPNRRAAEPSDEFAPSKANAHLPLPSPMGALKGAVPEPAPEQGMRARASTRPHSGSEGRFSRDASHTLAKSEFWEAGGVKNADITGITSTQYA